MHKVLLFAKFKLINFSEGETCSHEKKKFFREKYSWTTLVANIICYFIFLFYMIFTVVLYWVTWKTASIFSDQSSLFPKYSYKEIQQQCSNKNLLTQSPALIRWFFSASKPHASSTYKSDSIHSNKDLFVNIYIFRRKPSIGNSSVVIPL